MGEADLLDARRTFSEGRLREFRQHLAQLAQVRGLPSLCDYATGSYGRFEASLHSDIDLFFLHEGSHEQVLVSRLDELRLFAGVIDEGQGLAFPTFSNDGEFLRIMYLDDMLALLGGRRDDYQNFFTARMLLLLESAPLINDALYDKAINAIVDAYFRDYPDHATDFRPVFLINDVLRFWKTLCLNYEHRRNKPDDQPEMRRRQQVKNFKLKFSRLLTCFGTLVAICALPAPIESSSIVALTRRTPLQRFMDATASVAPLAQVRRAIIDDYSWFMQLTGQSTEELHAHFVEKPSKVELFRRADVFGQRIYEVLAYFAERNRYSRYLVI
jgi:hypothetical protein